MMNWFLALLGQFSTILHLRDARVPFAKGRLGERDLLRGERDGEKELWDVASVVPYGKH